MVAQITLLADTTITSSGQTIDIPIKVVGFSNIFSMQFSINWDSTVLDFKEVHSFTDALPQFGADGIGIQSTDSGKLISIWFDNSVTGISAADSTTLFVITFDVIGTEGTATAISFTDDPALIEVVDANSNILEATVIDGQVLLPQISTATTYLDAKNGMRLFQNHPNPFYNHTTIKTSFTSSQWVLLTLTDAQGRTVHTERFKSANGIKNLVIDKSQLPSTGIYNYTIQGTDFKLSKQMIFYQNN